MKTVSPRIECPEGLTEEEWVFGVIREVIARVLWGSEGDVSLDSHFVNDFDGLEEDASEVLLRIDDQLGVSMPKTSLNKAEEVEEYNITTMRALRDAYCALLAKRR
jgi:hypothetical protein